MAAARPSEEVEEDRSEAGSVRESDEGRAGSVRESDEEEDSYADSAFDSLDDGDGIRAVNVVRLEFIPPVFDVQRLAGPLNPIIGCSISCNHTILHTARGGQVQCRGGNGDGQLGVGDNLPHDGLRLTVPPVDAATVYACNGASFARRNDKAILSWGHPHRIGRDGPAAAPAVVEGLPPISLFATCSSRSIAISTEDEAFAWGYLDNELEMGVLALRPVPVAALSGRGVCRLALGDAFSVAETRQGQLLVWGGVLDTECGPQPVQLRPAEVRFPLRSLVNHSMYVYAADAVGAVWRIDLRCDLTAVGLTRGAVKLAQTDDYCAALTEEGDLWLREMFGSSWGRVRALRSAGPLGLVPYGGSSARELLLAPDYCGGKCRLRLFARIAMCIGIPSDPVREVLSPLVVHEVYLTGPSSDPFGCTVARG
eukprot:TRINITY_DN14503_c0_g2_i2.p1 TRINITY_DN14503_c0_g2~~TRINITY_DN14503_c0_g2_i2.p1  ORF type:complete len:455 (+),score=79.49 TRINITY_DN14503_c0_g2_i2:91-1365(+)